MQLNLRQPTLLLFSGLLGFVHTGMAQKSTVSARDLFRNKSSIALRCAVLKLDENTDFAEVLPNTTFHSGDEIRFSVVSNQGGYLYVLNKGSNGSWVPLYPDPSVDKSSNQIQAGERIVVPGGRPGDDPRDDIKFDAHAGDEHVFILLTRAPEPELDKLVEMLRPTEKTATPSSSVRGLSNSSINTLRQSASRDLVLTTPEGGTADKAVYAAAAEPSPQPDDRLVIELKLTHQ